MVEYTMEDIMENKEEKINKTVIYSGKVVTLHVDEVKCPNGMIAKREIIDHPGGVCILAFLDDNTILMEKQFRYAYDEVLYELPAGKLEKGENPKEAALRELEEETGYKAQSIQEYGLMYPSCGYTNEIIYLYVASNLKQTKQKLDVDESLTYYPISLDEAKDMVDKGIIKDAKSIILILKYWSEHK